MTMDGKYVPVILYPRFTTLVGEGVEFFTFPLDIAAYEGARLTFWRGPLLGTLPQMKFYLEESIDRQIWSTCSGIPATGFEISEATEAEKQFTFSKKWFRAMAILVGANATGTCWAQGFLVRRES